MDPLDAFFFNSSFLREEVVQGVEEGGQCPGPQPGGLQTRSQLS